MTSQIYPKTIQTAHVRQFPVVGIGASAGGLDAIQRLLKNLPTNTGFAFIVIQHLAASQESMLPEILSRSTKMTVQKISNGMQIEPNNVYVIPSGSTITIANDTLKLHPKGALFKPIDDFLCSLAVERKAKAIGVVLSGTGTDGTEGLKFVKAEGGITFAQDPKSAQYSDMPKNAIAADVVYFVFAPEQIAEELARIARHPEITRQKMMAAESTEPEKASSDAKSIFSLLQAVFNVNFVNYKQSTIERRIARRMILSKVESKKDYVAYLRAHKDELQALFDDLLIGVTGFFREPNAFEELRVKVFPNIVGENRPIRVWIPGCSTGEEAYSVAICIEEFLEEKNVVGRQIQIFGTDVNEKNIEKARHGVYLKTIEDSVSKDRLKRFFVAVNGHYQVAKSIRDMCVFAKHDLTRDPPFSNLNLIVCRNLLIYFDSKLQDRIIPLFHYGLRQGGYLVLGEAESVGKFAYLFESLSKKGVVFRRKQVQPVFEVQLQPSTPYSLRRAIEKPEKADSLSLLEAEVDKFLMSEYVPASLLLNSNLDVLVFRGKVDPFISVDAGVASLNASKIVRKELRAALQTAVYKAKRSKKDVDESVHVGQGKESRIVSICVKVLKLPKHEEAFFFVLFTETVREKFSFKAKKGVKEAEEAKDQQIKELSDDLNSTKQTLQTIIEQQEATNEELHSAMEEVQSSNEELMSTNEELETSKEELQSTNEELITLNDELKNRNQSLSILNDDLNNLMNSVDTAVVIVDGDFRIRRFTAQAQELLRLMPTDVGLPIVNFRLGIPVESLEKTLRGAISNLELSRQDITERGRWYQMRVRPYLTQEKKVGGAILSFSDVTELKRFEAEKQAHTENLELTVREQANKLVASEILATIGATAGMVGHDIRNPLQGISSDAFLIRSDLADLPDSEAKESIKESLEGIENNVDYIDKIVADLQDYAKIIKPVLKEIDLTKLCEDVLSKYVPDNVDAICRIDVEVEKIYIDPNLLKRVLSNLVSNAVQAMPDGGKLTLNACREATDVLIILQDTGVGIPEEIRPKLFVPLFTSKSKGQGFGLAVVKRITEALGGKVSFESEVGKGTKFIIRLPLSKGRKSVG